MELKKEEFRLIVKEKNANELQLINKAKFNCLDIKRYEPRRHCKR